jgi:hypothetical protein
MKAKRDSNTAMTQASGTQRVLQRVSAVAILCSMLITILSNFDFD